MPATSWSADDLAYLSELAAEGLPVHAIAERLGRTTSAIQTVLYRRGLSLTKHGGAVRERVLTLVAAGWSVSRIARQHGLKETAIRRLLAQDGSRKVPARPFPTGRAVNGEVAA